MEDLSKSGINRGKRKRPSLKPSGNNACKCLICGRVIRRGLRSKHLIEVHKLSGIINGHFQNLGVPFDPKRHNRKRRKKVSDYEPPYRWGEQTGYRDFIRIIYTPMK